MLREFLAQPGGVLAFSLCFVGGIFLVAMILSIIFGGDDDGPRF